MVVGAGSVEVGGGEAGIERAGGLDEGKAVGERRWSGVEFEGLDSGGGEEDLIEGEAVRSRQGDGDVSAVWWVEGAAEECYAHGVEFTVVWGGGCDA